MQRRKELVKKRFYVVIDLDIAEDYENIDLGNWLHGLLYGDDEFLDVVVYDSIEDIQADMKDGQLKNIGYD
jgi:hypothetical protein